MAAWFTGKRSPSLADRRSTEKLSLGRQYEDFAEWIAESQGLRLVRRNFRVGRLEGDLLLWCPERQTYLLWEVRGLQNSAFRPSVMLSRNKQERLQRLGTLLQRKLQAKLRIQLFEIQGKLPRVRWALYDLSVA